MYNKITVCTREEKSPTRLRPFGVDAPPSPYSCFSNMERERTPARETNKTVNSIP
jgi:hypothetical protein